MHAISKNNTAYSPLLSSAQAKTLELLSPKIQEEIYPLLSSKKRLKRIKMVQLGLDFLQICKDRSQGEKLLVQIIQSPDRHQARQLLKRVRVIVQEGYEEAFFLYSLPAQVPHYSLVRLKGICEVFFSALPYFGTKHRPAPPAIDKHNPSTSPFAPYQRHVEEQIREIMIAIEDLPLSIRRPPVRDFSQTIKKNRGEIESISSSSGPGFDSFSSALLSLLEALKSSYLMGEYFEYDENGAKQNKKMTFFYFLSQIIQGLKKINPREIIETVALWFIAPGWKGVHSLWKLISWGIDQSQDKQTNNNQLVALKTIYHFLQDSLDEVLKNQLIQCDQFSQEIHNLRHYLQSINYKLDRIEQVLCQQIVKLKNESREQWLNEKVRRIDVRISDLDRDLINKPFRQSMLYIKIFLGLPITECFDERLLESGLTKCREEYFIKELGSSIGFDHPPDLVQFYTAVDRLERISEEKARNCSLNALTKSSLSKEENEELLLLLDILIGQSTILGKILESFDKFFEHLFQSYVDCRNEACKNLTDSQVKSNAESSTAVTSQARKIARTPSTYLTQVAYLVTKIGLDILNFDEYCAREQVSKIFNWPRIGTTLNKLEELGGNTLWSLSLQPTVRSCTDPIPPGKFRLIFALNANNKPETYYSTDKPHEPQPPFFIQVSTEWNINPLSKDAFHQVVIDDKESAIKLSDLQSFPPISEHQFGFCKRIEDLFDTYCNFLRTPANASAFKERLGKYGLISSHSGNLIPLAFPQEMLDQVNKEIFEEVYLTGMTKKGFFWASYDFLENPTSNKYSLSLIYHYGPGNTKNEWTKIVVAEVDSLTVHAYKRIAPGCTILDPDLNEVLLTLMYNDGLEIPGEKSHPLESKGGLVMANLVPFAGFYKIWQKYPSHGICFNSQKYNCKIEEIVRTGLESYPQLEKTISSTALILGQEADNMKSELKTSIYKPIREQKKMLANWIWRVLNLQTSLPKQAEALNRCLLEAHKCFEKRQELIHNGLLVEKKMQFQGENSESIKTHFLSELKNYLKQPPFLTYRKKYYCFLAFCRLRSGLPQEEIVQLIEKHLSIPSPYESNVLSKIALNAHQDPHLGKENFIQALGSNGKWAALLKHQIALLEQRRSELDQETDIPYFYGS